MTVSEIQTNILNETGIKTTVKKYKKGSLKGYVRITPMFQNGCYPSFPFDFVQKLKSDISEFNSDEYPIFCSCSDIHIHEIEDDRIQMKKEKKPKEIDENKISKGWGSKNSQLRLDKATARNAKKLQKGGVARYY